MILNDLIVNRVMMDDAFQCISEGTIKATDEEIILITVRRPEKISSATKHVLRNRLHNLKDIFEFNQQLFVVLNNLQGYELDQYLDNQQLSYDRRIYLCYEMLKVIYRYDAFSDNIKYQLIALPQWRVADDVLMLREIIHLGEEGNYTPRHFYAQIGLLMEKILASKNEHHRQFMDNLILGNVSYPSLDVLIRHFKDIFIYEKPEAIESIPFEYHLTFSVSNDSVIAESASLNDRSDTINTAITGIDESSDNTVMQDGSEAEAVNDDSVEQDVLEAEAADDDSVEQDVLEAEAADDDSVMQDVLETEAADDDTMLQDVLEAEAADDDTMLQDVLEAEAADDDTVRQDISETDKNDEGAAVSDTDEITTNTVFSTGSTMAKAETATASLSCDSIEESEPVLDFLSTELPDFCELSPAEDPFEASAKPSYDAPLKQKNRPEEMQTSEPEMSKSWQAFIFPVAMTLIFIAVIGFGIKSFFFKPEIFEASYRIETLSDDRVAFINTSACSKPIESCEWSVYYNDQLIQSFITDNLYPIFDTVGEYTISLRIMDSDGNWSDTYTEVYPYDRSQ
ncbi:hypothetical protein KHM83_03280 [Fusibacter paucivorans]|uniref:PKD domain-containing protein n=1 Tax=Fusibacter paucivorans TaxID=76009 RepID=A0ABS5PMR8_9FIRM|nr:hypothetical protein [Fusibacter paucivorans]MBS7525694.1 hypothetical protein [Fusibacter paucivorans]